MSEKMPAKDIKEIAPYIISVAGSIVGVAANFTKYLTVSNFLFSRKVSVFQLILETIDKPETALGTIGDKIAFGIIVAGTLFTVFAAINAISKRMKGAIVWTVLAFLPFLMIGKAWFHYAGFSLTIIGSIWYLMTAY